MENNTSDTDYVILIYQRDAMECTGSYFHLHLLHNWIQKYTIDKLAVQSPWLQTLFQDVTTRKPCMNKLKAQAEKNKDLWLDDTRLLQSTQQVFDFSAKQKGK